MPVPDYRHLFEQAQNLIAPSAAGPPRQVDLRRAISACYYGLFHFIAAHAADEFVGATCRPPSKRSAPYVRAYRSIPHGHLKAICGQGSGANSIFSSPLKNFMVTVLDAQDKRHSADYDRA